MEKSEEGRKPFRNSIEDTEEFIQEGEKTTENKTVDKKQNKSVKSAKSDRGGANKLPRGEIVAKGSFRVLSRHL